MNKNNLNDFLDDYARTHSPEPSRALLDNIMAIPREVEQGQSFKLPSKISEWFLFLVPRLSGLTAACVLGLYIGGTSSSALAEDEIAEIDSYIIEASIDGEEFDDEVVPLLDVEEFIFVEENAQ
ncbi:MAG: hypothetical protein P8J14_12415 [Emcibacteraceae bacterium]|nr:hypothetical protein [Emcibacteraceae bacterium]